MKKFIAILLCYSILMLPAGCKSSKLITTDEAATMKGAQNYLILHTPNRNYKIHNYKFTTDSIEGNLQVMSSGKTNTINLFTQMNFDIELKSNSAKFIRLSKADITKITYLKFNAGNTVLAIVGGLGVIAIIAAIVANNMSFNIDFGG